MVASNKPFPAFEVKILKNRLFIPVPWDSAEPFRDRLRARGIAATACFDPSEHTAGLEFGRDADLETIRVILSAPQG